MNSALEITSIYIVLPILSISLLLILIRLAIGPSLLDRVIATDLLITTIIAIILTFSIMQEEENLIDVVVVLTILLFLNTIAFAYYFEKRG